MIDDSLTKLFTLVKKHKHPAILLSSYLTVGESIYIPDRIELQSVTMLSDASPPLYYKGSIVHTFPISSYYKYNFKLYFTHAHWSLVENIYYININSNTWQLKYVVSNVEYLFNNFNSNLINQTWAVTHSEESILNLEIQTRGNNGKTILT